MNIKIIKGSICHNNKEFVVNDEIKQIKREDGDRLIKLGYAEEVEKKSTQNNADNTDDSDESSDSTDSEE